MQKLIDEVRDQFNKGSHIAHGFDHVERVVKLIRYIAEKEGYDVEIATVTAYLHDIGRTVQEAHEQHGPAGVKPARQLLDKYTNYDNSTKEEILKAIHDHTLLRTEGHLTHILQDADKLDGLGAIGIMRVYSYRANLPCYKDEENIIPEDITSISDTKYISTMHDGMAFQMRWANLMYTNTAKKVAKIRYAKMQKFMEDFKQEVAGLDLKI